MMQQVDSDKPATASMIEALRNASRELVRELGFMRTTLADTEFAPSAVHALLEIGNTPGISAKNLAQRLRLDKSSTSRQLARLQAQQLVFRKTDEHDARTSALYLTPHGEQLKQRIDQFATRQVASALQHINLVDQHALVRTLGLYVNALGRQIPISGKENLPYIHEGYQPGCIGEIASLHGRFYAKHWGFGSFFEQKVATELSMFCSTLPAQGKALWLYQQHERVLASLAIDGDPASGLAHLRWFIVDESLHGSGIGRQLMTLAMQFVDQHFHETYLWTFKGLDAARHLYESFGFALLQQHEGSQWGCRVTQQQFRRLNSMPMTI